MNVPCPCHVSAAGVGKQSVWGLRIIAESQLQIYHIYSNPPIAEKLAGRPGVKPGFAASDATVLFVTPPAHLGERKVSAVMHELFARAKQSRLAGLRSPQINGTRAGNPTRISSLGPKRHDALDHASVNEPSN